MNEKFVITIARGYGSGGRTIGKMLSKNLSIPFYDRDLVYMASEESGINVKLFGQNDESVKKSIFSPASDRYTGDLIPPESSAFVSHKNIFNYQAKIIKDLAVKGSCIIVGRCADYILRDMPNVVKVFVWAPMSDCIKNVKVPRGGGGRYPERADAGPDPAALRCGVRAAGYARRRGPAAGAGR